MATVLDIGLLEDFSIIFSMLLILVLLYAIFQFTKALGGKKGIDSLVAIIIAILMLFVPSALEVINTIIPWFVVLFIFIILLLTTYRIFGASDEDISETMKKYSQITYFLIIIGVVIFLGGLGKVFFTGGSDDVTVEVTAGGTIIKGDIGTEGTDAFWGTLFHPKVLGLIIVMLIGVFTIAALATEQRPPPWKR